VQRVWGKVGAVRPSDRAELINKDLLKYRRVLQWLENRSEQAIVHFNDPLNTIIEAHGQSIMLERLYGNDARHDFTPRAR